ncbi:MAG: hypothetical protein QOC81_1048 [Thermoanaerobaculia bacterium]|jgi:hypothetical protein|nr:hypothetical protein [Thermoanaerobaculia bacterium]
MTMRKLTCSQYRVVFFFAISFVGAWLHGAETFSGEPYEMHFRDAEVSAALHVISSKTGLNFVMAANQRPRITGDFSDRWDAIISRIVASNKLTYRVADTFLLVGRNGEQLMDPRLALVQAPKDELPMALNVVNASLKDVVTILVEKLLAMKLDLHGLPLRGYVTVQAADVSPRKLLQLLLAANGYEFEEHGNVIRLGLLSGFDLPVKPERTPELQCQSTECDDISSIALRGTVTPKKEGSKTTALLEFPDDHFSEVESGAAIGKRAHTVEVKPRQVSITNGRSNPSTAVIFRIEGIPGARP